MMHPALALLLKLRGKALLRRIGRGLKKPAGILFALFAALIVTLWLVPVVIGIFAGEMMDPEPVRRFGPVVLLVIALANMLNRNAQHSVNFTPTEVDMLYPAPFTRRELLMYKMSIALLSSLGVGLLFSLFLYQFASRWVFVFVSMTLAMLLVNLLSMAAILGGQYLGLVLRTFASKLIAGMIAGALLVLTAATIPIDPDQGLKNNVQAILDSPPISTILLPFSVFTEALTAESWLLFAGLTAIAALMCLAMFAVNLLLDERNIDHGIERATQHHQHMERARKRAGVALTYSKRSVRWRISELPWLGGAGPILHRQLTTVLRGARSLVMPLAMQLLVFGAMVGLIGRESEAAAIGIAVAAVIMFAMAMPQMLLFDFRGDLDQMDWLKMLPIPPVPLVIGELVTPVVLITALQWLLLAFTAVIVPDVSLGWLAAIAVTCLPLNFLNLAIDNGTFLAYPTRRIAAGLSDLTTLGRNMMLFIVKSLILFGCLGTAALFGWLASWIAGTSVAFVIVGWLVLAAACVGIVPIVAKLFQQFDISRDMPA